MPKIVTTKITETSKGHQVSFTIGVQTFTLRELEGEEGMNSLEYAKWYESMLNKAFDNYEKLIKNN